jgi:hypothetical protein
LRTDGDNAFVDNGYLTYEYNLPILIDVEKLVDNTKVLTFSNKSILFYTGVVATATVAYTVNFERDNFKDIITWNEAANDYSIMVLTKNPVDYTATFYDHSSIDYNNTTVNNDPPFLIEVDEKTTTYLTFTNFKKSDIHFILDAELYNNLNTYNNLAGNILNATTVINGNNATTVINGNIKFDSTDNKYSFNFPHPIHSSDDYSRDTEYSQDMQDQYNLVHRTRIHILHFNNSGGNWSHSVSLWAKFETFTMLVKNIGGYQGDLAQCLFEIGKRIPFNSAGHNNRQSGVYISNRTSTGKQTIKWSFYSNDVYVDVEIDTDKWYHFCFTYDGTVRKIYLNSFLIKEEQVSLSLNIHADAWLSLGSILYKDNYSSKFTNNTYLNGEIRRFVVFNKALTDNEVQIMFNDNNFIYAIPFKHPEPSTPTYTTTPTPFLLIDGKYSFRNDENTHVYDLSQNLRIGVGKSLKRDVEDAINFTANYSFISFDGISGKNGNWSHTISMKVKFNRIHAHLLFYLGNDLHRDAIYDDHVFPLNDGTTKDMYVDTQAIYAYAYSTNTGIEKIGWQLGKRKIGEGTRCEFLQNENSTSNWFNNDMYNRFVWITFVYNVNSVTLYIDGNLIDTKNVNLQLNLPPIWGITLGRKLIWENDFYYRSKNDVDLKRFEMYDGELSETDIQSLYSSTSSGYTNYIDIDDFKKHYNYFPVLMYDANKQLELSQENQFLQTTNIIDFSINNFNPSVVNVEVNNGAFILNKGDSKIELVIDRTHHFPLLSSTPAIQSESNWSHSIAMIIMSTDLPNADTSIMDVLIKRDPGEPGFSFIRIFPNKIEWQGGTISTSTSTTKNFNIDIVQDTIQYIFLTYDASTSTRRLYLGDGQNTPTEISSDSDSSLGSISFDTSATGTPYKLNIGRMVHNGKLYKFMIYDYVLDTDITAIYNMYKAELDPITLKSTPIFENDPDATTYVNDINFLYTWNLDDELTVDVQNKTNTGNPVYDSEGIDDYSAELLPSSQSEITQLERYYDFVSKKPIIYWKDNTYNTDDRNYAVRYRNEVDTEYIINPDTNTIELITDLVYEQVRNNSENNINDPVFTHKCILSSTDFDSSVVIQIQLLTEPGDLGSLLQSNTYTRTYDALTGDDKSVFNALNINITFNPGIPGQGSGLTLSSSISTIRPDITYSVVNNTGVELISEKELIRNEDYNPLQEYIINSGYLESFIRVDIGIKSYLQNSVLIYDSLWSKLNSQIQIQDLSSWYSSIIYHLDLSWKSNIHFANYVIQSNGENIDDEILKLASTEFDSTKNLYNYTYTIPLNLRTPIKVIATFPYATTNIDSAVATLGFLSIEERLTRDDSSFGSNIRYKEIYNTQTTNSTLFVEYESTISSENVHLCLDTLEITKQIESMNDPLENPLLSNISENTITGSTTKYIEIPEFQDFLPITTNLLIVNQDETHYFKLTDGQILYNSNNTIKITPLDIISATTKYRLIITNNDSQDNTYSKYIYRSTDLSENLEEFLVNNATNYTFQFETKYLFVDEALRLIGNTDSTSSNLIVREYNDVVLESTFTSDIESKYFSISNIDIQVNLQDEGYLIDIKFDSWLGGQYNISIDDEVITSRTTTLPNVPPEIGTIFELSTQASPSTVLNTFEVVQIPNYDGEYILLKQRGTDHYMRHKDHICEMNQYEGNVNYFMWKFDGQYIESPYGGSGSYLVFDNNELMIKEKSLSQPTSFIFNILYGKHVISYGEQEGESVVDFKEIGMENRQLSISKVILDKTSDNVEKEQFSFADFDISTQNSSIKINFIYVEGINIVLDIDDNNTDKKSIVVYNLYKNNSFNRVKRFELSSTASNKLRISKFDLSLQLNDSLDLREENILGFEKYKGELFFIKLNPIYNLRIERGKTDSDGNYNNNIYSFTFDDDKIEDESAVNLYFYNLYKDDVLIQENIIEQVIEVIEYNDINMYGIWRIEKRSNLDLVLENAGTIEIKKPNAPKNIFVFKEINGDLTHTLIFDSDEFFSNSTFKVFIRFSSRDEDVSHTISEHTHSFIGQHDTTIKIQEISYLGHESDITDTLTLTRPTPFSSLTTTFDDAESEFILSWF